MAQTSTTTYKISFKKIAHAAAAEVRVHKKIAIISYVLFGVAFLLFLLNGSVEADEYKVIQAVYNSNWGNFFAAAGVGIGYFTVLNVFRDMSNQQFCDVSMALPIKSSERFLSKLLSLVYLQIAPLAVSVICGKLINLLLNAIGSAGIGYNAFNDIFTPFFTFFASSMFIMAITVFCTCCCGALAESAYFSVILAGIINILPFYFIYNIVCPSAGLSPYRITDLIDIGYWGLLFFDYYEELIPHCAIGSLISLIVMLLSGFIYIRRDARSVGKPISNRLFFEIVMFAGCAMVFSVAFMNREFGWGLLIAGVIYVIINIIVSRAKINFLSFVKWIGKFAGTVAAFLLVSVVTIKTYGFGLVNIRPNTKYLDGTCFTISYYQYDDITGFGRYERKYYSSAALSAEQANQVIDIYQKHFKNSVNQANPFNLMFGYTHGPEDVSINVENSRIIAEKPYPEYFFTYSYRYNDPDHYKATTYYTLEYENELLLSNSELSALIDELTQQGLVRDVTEKEPEVYTETY